MSRVVSRIETLLSATPAYSPSASMAQNNCNNTKKKQHINPMNSYGSLPGDGDDAPVTFLSAMHKVQRLQKKQRSQRLLEKERSRRSISASERMALTEEIMESYDGSRQKQLGNMNESLHELPEEKGLTMSTKDALIEICFRQYVSILLLAAPFACIANAQHWNDAWIFWLNFVVMIPLAAILGEFTEELALHTNQTIGGLVNATFGNAVEIVVAIQALLANEIRVVQASMLGSIFSNLLLVLGSCFFFGGLFHKEQSYNSVAATSSMGLLALSSIALVLPTPFAEYYNIEDEEALVISRISAIFLLFMYLQLLFFQLYTHTYIFEEAPEENGGDEQEVARVSLTVATVGLCALTLLVTFFSEYLVGSIDGYCETSGVSRTFVGVIILPIVGNAVEHISAVTVAVKDKMDLSMGSK